VTPGARIPVGRTAPGRFAVRAPRAGGGAPVRRGRREGAVSLPGSTLSGSTSNPAQLTILLKVLGVADEVVERHAGCVGVVPPDGCAAHGVCEVEAPLESGVRLWDVVPFQSSHQARDYDFG
jgi:hypothetical protein